MTAVPHPLPGARRAGPALGRMVLSGAAAFWLSVALIGQWAFFSYIAAFYGPSTLSGHFELWNRLSAFGRTPYVPGDTAGNLTYAAHALAAGVVALGGALQFVPMVRNRWPRFHRINGRVFLSVVVALSLSGFYLVWMRHAPPHGITSLGTTLNGVLILACAAMTLRHALARRIDIHQRWALRLFLVSNGQWFMRIGVFSYFVVGMAFGYKAHFTDPFVQVWTYGCYLVPLVAAEAYLRARDTGRGRILVGTGLTVLTLLMAVGVLAFGAFSLLIVSGGPLKLPG